MNVEWIKTCVGGEGFKGRVDCCVAWCYEGPREGCFMNTLAALLLGILNSLEQCFLVSTSVMGLSFVTYVFFFTSEHLGAEMRQQSKWLLLKNFGSRIKRSPVFVDQVTDT